jgi:cell division control protein 24
LLLNRGSADQSLGSSLKKPLDNRARVVQELVDTERKYVQDLENLQDYMRCLESQEVISKDVIHNMFLNLNQLVDFQRRFLIRVETQNDLPVEQQNWGKLFVQYVTILFGNLQQISFSSDTIGSRKNLLLSMNRMLPTSMRPNALP